MGSESSQMEKPSASQLPGSQEDGQSVEADADAASTAGSNKTSGSRALARDLERSVFESSQDYTTQPPPKNRRKRMSAQSEVSVMSDALGILPDDAAVASAHSGAVQSDIDEDDVMAFNGHVSGLDSPQAEHRAATRKHLVREMRRLKKTVLVNSGRARWAPSINGAKWEVEKLPPGQWSNRELTIAEKSTLARYKVKAKDAKQRLKEFDRNAGRNDAERGADRDDQMSEDEPAAMNHDTLVQASDKMDTQQAVAEEKPGGETREHKAVELPSRKERQRQKRTQRKSNTKPDVEVRDEEPQPRPELERQQIEQSGKKRKRLQTESMTSIPPQQTTAIESMPILRSVAGKHKTEMVKTWLNSQGPEDDIEDAPERDDAEALEPLQKRKRVSKHQEDADQDYQPVNQDEEDLQAAESEEDLPTLEVEAVHLKKTGRSGNSKRTTHVKQQAQSESSQAAHTQSRSLMSTGAFTTDEKSLADKIFSQVLHSEGIDEATLKHKICKWRTAGTFKEEIEAAFPARDKASLRKFCQRRFHMQERGPWTAEQDDSLRNAQANYPDQWTKLQDLVGRTAADCKDRWTKHLQHDKRTGPWSQDEEDKLVAAVERAIDAIKNDSTIDPSLAADRGALENAVSWNIIAKQLGNLRNYKQCREKWAKLKRRENRVSVTLGGNTHAAGGEARPSAKKIDAARKKVRTFEIGDFYDIFVEIHTSFDDTSHRYHDEQTTLWSIVSQKNMSSRFSLSSKGGALRRVALEHALQEWKIDSKKVRRRLETSETLPAKAKVLAKLLEKSYAGRLHAMSRTFMPELAGKEKNEILKLKAEMKKSFAEKRKLRTPNKTRAKVQSTEFVNDIDEEEEEEEAEIDVVDNEEVGVVPPTPALDDEEEDESDEDQSEEDQSVCQRRLDAHLIGRQGDHEANSEASDVNVQPRSRSGKLAGSRTRSPQEGFEEDSGPSADAGNALIKKESSEDESESVHSWPPVDPNDPHDAEILRRFDAALAEQNLPTPPVCDSDDDEDEDDDDDDDDDEHREANGGLSSRYAVSLEGAETPVIGRDHFMKICRQ